jgi:ParB family chromosome partitioning protein
MQIDIDLIHTGHWTEHLRQDDITSSEVERARFYGIVDDVHVRRLPEQPGHYEILGTPRSWLLAQLIQDSSVPAKLLDHLNVSEIEGLYAPKNDSSGHFIEQAVALKEYIEDNNLSLAKAGKLKGKSRSEVCNLMRILKIDYAIQSEIKRLPYVYFGHARIMANLDYSKQRQLLDQIKEKHLSVQQAEAIVRKMHGKASKNQSINPLRDKDPNTVKLENSLTEHFGARSEIDENNGYLKINYNKNLDILQGILEKMGVTGQN